MSDGWGNRSLAEIRKLTDWQIHNLIFLPAIRAAAKRERDANPGLGLPRKRRGKKHKMRLPNKEEYFLVGEKLGMPRDRMEQEWAKAMETNGSPQPNPHR